LSGNNPDAFVDVALNAKGTEVTLPDGRIALELDPNVPQIYPSVTPHLEEDQ
jgi:hypothetical protein